MPSERAISQMVDVFTDVIDLGGTEERTAIVPNLSVIDAAPTGLTNFIIVQDDRDGDNILAKTVPGVVYANNDKVNVLFIRGAEPIAFQQGSESANAGLWEIVPSTSTDIFYDKGNVGIGKSVAPDASLEVLDTAQAQLRLTHTEDTKFVDFTLDTNHDLTITPSSTGQIILQPTTDSVDFFQVLDADGGTPILSVDSTNEHVGVGVSSPNNKLEVIAPATESSFHIGAAQNLGAYLTSSSSDNMIVSGGAEWISPNWTARSTVAEILSLQTGLFLFLSDTGLTPGNTFTPTERMRLDTSGNLGIGTAGPDAKLDVLATTTQLRLTHTDGSKFVDFMLDTNHDLTIKPSSTGQIKLQPTTDSTDFFQVLDADGGTPILNVDSTNERVGIGINGPASTLDINGDTTLSGGAQSYLFTDNGNQLALQGQSAATAHFLGLYSSDGDGTDDIDLSLYGLGTPASVVNRERLQVRYESSGPHFEVFTEAGGTGTLRPLIIYTEGNSNQIYLETDGDVGIGSSTTSAKLHVDQASTTAAKPVAYFDQADVSEEMFQFATTIGVGNAIEAVGAKTLTTTHFIKVTIPGGLTRYFPVGTIA